MGDFRARQRVKIHDGTDEFAVTVGKPIYVKISDGVESANVNASNQLEVDVKTAVISVDDNGSTLSIDDNGGSITVDGTVAISGTVPVSATDLDIRDLDKTQDDILIYANTVKDGSGTDLIPLVDADGHLQIDVLSGGDGYAKVDDSAFSIGVDEVIPMGALADEAATDSVDEGDIGIPRMTLDRKLLTRIVGASDANRLDVNASGQAQIDIAAVSVTAIPISKDASANAETNPIYVQVVTGVISGIEIHDYDTSAAIAKDASDNHDYSVANATFFLKSVIVAASGAMKITVQAGPVAALVTKAVIFTSASKPTEQITFDPPIEVPVATSGTVRVIRRNDDNQAMDVYSTIVGNDA